MKNRTHHQIVIISGIMLGLLLSGVPAAFAEKDLDNDYDREGWEEEANKMQDELGLSQQQREALKSNKEKHREGMKALREELKQQQEALRQEMQKSDFDAGRVRMINDEINRLRNEISDRRIDGIVEVREILTPEQYSRFQNLKESRRGEWRERRDERGEGSFRERIRERIEERRDK